MPRGLFSDTVDAARIAKGARDVMDARLAVSARQISAPLTRAGRLNLVLASKYGSDSI